MSHEQGHIEGWTTLVFLGLAVARLRHHVPLGFHGTFTQRVAA